MTTWSKELEIARSHLGDESPIERCTLSPDQMDVEFDDSFGGTNGIPFLAWSSDHVYFCIEYDGSESVAGVPRNPSTSFEIRHYGG